jgi:hypothetical protein
MQINIDSIRNQADALKSQINDANGIAKFLQFDKVKYYFLQKRIFNLAKEWERAVSQPQDLLTKKDISIIDSTNHKITALIQTFIKKNPSYAWMKNLIVPEFSVQQIKNEALQRAIEAGDLKATEIALALGAKVESQHINVGIDAPISFSKKFLILEFLLRQEIMIRGNHPMDVLIKGDHPQLSKEEKGQIAKLLFSKGIGLTSNADRQYVESFFALFGDPNQLPSEVTTPLHNLVENFPYTLEGFEFLAPRAKDLINLFDQQGLLPIHKLMTKLKDDSLRSLVSTVKQYQEINSKTKEGNTLLHETLKILPNFFFYSTDFEGNKKKVLQGLQTLIAAGANPGLPNARQELPLFFAMNHCPDPRFRYEICAELCDWDQIKSHYPAKEIHLALENGWNDILGLLIEKYGWKNEAHMKASLEDLSRKGDLESILTVLNRLDLAKMSISAKNLVEENIFPFLADNPSRHLMDIKQKDISQQFASSEQTYNINQKYYNEQCYRAILKAAEKFKEGAWHFRELLDFFAATRKRLAQELARENRTDLVGAFGNPRYGDENDLGSETPMDGIYESYKKRVMALADSASTSNLQIMRTKEGRFIKAQIFGRPVGEEKIPLTTLTSRVFNHTAASEIPKVLKEVEFLLNELQVHAKEEDLEVLSHRIGEIHWWLSQAMPWERGSSAVTDMFAKMLFMLSGYPLPRWKPGIMPDCEALVTPSAQEYGEKYSSFFERKPLPIEGAQKIKSSQETKGILLRILSSRCKNSEIAQELKNILK